MGNSLCLSVLDVERSASMVTEGESTTPNTGSPVPEDATTEESKVSLQITCSCR